MADNDKRERSHWRGYVSFGLVSIPVQLFPTVNKSAHISFHQIDKRNHARIHYQRVNENTGKVVEWKNIIKGYEYEKDTIIPVPDDILEKVGGESVRSIDIDTFIKQQDLDFVSVDKSYFVVPDKKGEKGYLILREALKNSDKIGIARVILSTKEYVAALMPYGEHGLVLYLLHYDKEMRKVNDMPIPDKNLSHYKISKKEIDVAEKLIASMSSKWKPASYKDEYQEKLHQWLKEVATKKPHRQLKAVKTKKPSNVVNFVDLLKKSIEMKNKKAKA
jgi:DNA end-binding protein Ku